MKVIKLKRGASGTYSLERDAEEDYLKFSVNYISKLERLS
jgi:hypothetical protein